MTLQNFLPILSNHQNGSQILAVPTLRKGQFGADATGTFDAFVEGPVREAEGFEGGVADAFVGYGLRGGLPGAGEVWVAGYHLETGGEGADFGAFPRTEVGGVKFVVDCGGDFEV